MGDGECPRTGGLDGWVVDGRFGILLNCMCLDCI